MDNLATDLTIAFRNLLAHVKRTLFLGGAITLVTGLLIVLLGLSAGIRDTMIRSATTLTTGHVNVGGFYKITAGTSAPVVTDFKKVLAVAKAAVPELDYATARGRGWAKLVSDTSGQQVGVNGINIENEPGFQRIVRLASGSLADLSKPNTVLLFESQAKKLEVKVGDTLTLSAPTNRGTNNTIDVQVAGIAADIGLLSAWNVYVPVQTLRDLYQLNDTSTGFLLLYLRDMKDVKKVAARLREALGAAGYRLMDHNPVAFWMKFDTVNREDWTGQKLDITEWEDEVSFMSWTLATLDGLTVLLIGILLVIVVIGIMNTMWIAIRERTREIGTLRAIGMQRRRVLRMFVLESLLLGLLGTSLGALVGMTVAGVVNAIGIKVPLSVQLFVMSDTLVLAVKSGSTLRAIAAITFVATLASIYPSVRAAKLRPVTAMHHIG